MPNLVELREESEALERELASVFEEMGPHRDLDLVTRVTGTHEEKLAWIQGTHKRLNDLGQQIDTLDNLSSIEQLNELRRERMPPPGARPPMPGANGNGGGRYLPQKSLREVLAAHKGLSELKAGLRTSVQIDLPGLDFKTLVTLTDMSPQRDRLDLVTMAVEERTVADLLVQGATTRAGVEYYEETTLTNNAATVAEGVAKPESALGWTLRQEPIRKIATWIPATDEVLDDNPFLESQIRGRLTYMVQRVEEAQILSGNGSGQNLTGLLNRSGIQTYAKQASEDNPTAIYKAMQLIRGSAGAGFAEPTGVVLNPTNWTAIATARTADGLYIWGHPSDVGPDRLWGKTVRQTTGITAGTALVGAFRPHGEVLRRTGISVTLSTEHATNFTENKVTILAEERLGLAVYRPSAFATATALA